MSLERQRVTVPMASGHDASVDDRVQSAVKLLRLENCEWVDRGAVRQRRGWAAIDSVADARCLFSTGDELCAVVKDKVRAYDPVGTAWRTRAGCVSPWGLERRVVMRDELTFSVCTSNNTTTGLIGHASQIVTRNPASGDYYSGVTFAITNEDNQMVHAPATRYSFANFDTNPEDVGCNPRVIRRGTSAVVMIYQEGADVGTPASLHAITGGAAGFGDSGQIVTGDVSGLGGLLLGYVHDAVGLPTTSSLVVAYIQDTTLDCIVNLYDSLSVVADTVTIPGPITRLALEASPNGAVVYVAVYDGADIKMYSYIAAAGTLTPLTGPVVVGSPSEAIALGVATGVISGTPRLAITWYDGSGSRAVTTDVTGAPVDGTRTIWNTMPVTRPWWNGEDAYVALCNSMPGDRALESVVAVVNIRAGALTYPNKTPFIGAFHHIGQAPRGEDIGTIGFGMSVSNVLVAQDGSYHYDIPSRAQAGGSDEIVLSYLPNIGAISAYKGTALIGGGLVSWYDGVRAFELGTPIGVVADHVQVTTGAGTLIDDVVHQLAAISNDMRGVQHRGLPGPALTTTITAPNNAVQLDIYYSSLTNRADSDAICDQLALQIYRADGSGGFGQVVHDYESRTNSIYAAGTSKLTATDIGGPTGALLYTSTGEVEALSPEGGLYPAMVAGRCWLTQCGNPTVVPFSKPLRATASGARQAPEFNQDVFGFVLPGDDRAIAVASLDDKIVVFSSSHTYLQAGDGPDSSGQGVGFGALQLISADVGCVDARSVVTTPAGVFFQADAGIYLLTRNLEIQSVGESVRDLIDSYPVVTSAVLVASRYQVRFTLAGSTVGSGGTMVVYDYRLGTWSRWVLLEDGGAPTRWIGGCMHQGVHYLLSDEGRVAYESSADYRDTYQGSGDGWISQAIELGWVQLTGQSGWQRAWGWVPLLKILGFDPDAPLVTFGLTAKLYSDFNDEPDNTITISAADILTYPELPRVQPMIEVRRQECQAAKLRLETTDPGIGTVDVTSARGFSCAGVTLEVGAKMGKTKGAVVARV